MFFGITTERLTCSTFVTQAQELQHGLRYKQIGFTSKTLRYLQLYEQLCASIPVSRMQIVISSLDVVFFVPIYLRYVLEVIEVIINDWKMCFVDQPGVKTDGLDWHLWKSNVLHFLGKYHVQECSEWFLRI